MPKDHPKGSDRYPKDTARLISSLLPNSSREYRQCRYARLQTTQVRQATSLGKLSVELVLAWSPASRRLAHGFYRPRFPPPSR